MKFLLKDNNKELEEGIEARMTEKVAGAISGISSSVERNKKSIEELAKKVDKIAKSYSHEATKELVEKVIDAKRFQEPAKSVDSA